MKSPLAATDRERVLARVQKTLELASRRLGRTVPGIEVRFDLRGRAAGQFRLQRRRPGRTERCIRFNPWVFAIDLEHHLKETVPHEVAHYLVSLASPKARPHGPEWADWMRFFGCKPQATGDYSLAGVPVRRQRRHACRCGCPGRIHAISTTRRNRMTRGVVYLCPDCRTPLLLEAEEKGRGKTQKI